MSNNAQKTPLNRSLNKIAQTRIAQALQLLGRALPSQVVSVGPSNSIVTVSINVQTDLTLPQITIPVAMPEYIRLPLQPGDFGLTIPSDVLLGASTGLGQGVPLLSSQPANLQGLLFLPYGSANFSDTDDQNALVLYGPDGVIIRDKGSNCVWILTASGITVSC